jgi:hypothetical protein
VRKQAGQSLPLFAQAGELEHFLDRLPLVG